MKNALLLAALMTVCPASAITSQRASSAADDVRDAASRDTALRIVVSVDTRRLRVLEGNDTILTAVVAVGSGARMTYDKSRWSFATPRGVRTVIEKERDPVWIAPDWHFVEVARSMRAKLVWLPDDTIIPFTDGSHLEVRRGAVRLATDSTLNDFANANILLDGVLFVPPLGSPNRRIEGELGKFRLLLGEGLGIHGTRDARSIGKAVTHGCIRLSDADIAWLFDHVPVGTRVYIY